MSSLTSIVLKDGLIRRGDPDSDSVKVLQQALIQAGYRLAGGTPDGIFGPRTEQVVRQFQLQHGLPVDGIVGIKTADLLDKPHQELVEAATPLRALNGMPHDDTASLKAFYGDPSVNFDSWKASNVTSVQCPWELYYDGKLWPHPIQFHKKAAPALARVFDAIWAKANSSNSSRILDHVRNFSGSGNYRPVRGSSRLSCHAFWAAIDFDAERLPLGVGVPVGSMPQDVVDAFKSEGFFWGGDYTGRKDPMHFQSAHE